MPVEPDISNVPNNENNLRLYVKQVTLAQEEERLRIARELHDSTVQSLIAILHQSENFMAKNQNFSTMPYTRFLLQLTEQLKSVIKEVRHLSSNLRPSILDHLGLLPSLDYLAEELRKNYGIRTRLEVKGPLHRFQPEVEVSIFRIIQEALNNVARHAEASRVDISIQFGRDTARFVVRDNGIGISGFPEVKAILLSNRKLGLAGMFERAKLINAEIVLETAPGEGTVIYISVPIAGEPV